MYSDLLINIFIIGFSLFLVGEIAKDTQLDKNLPISRKICVGLVAGIIGTVLMIYSIQLDNYMIIDLRHLAVIVPAIYCGTLAAVVSAVTIGIMRIILFGFSYAAIGGIIAIGISMLTCTITNSLNRSRKKKYAYMNLLSITSAFVVIYFEINRTSYLYKALLNFLIFSILGAIATYLIAEYVKKANVYFREIKNYSMMANNLTDLITTQYPDGRFKYASPVCEIFTGWSQKELVGKHSNFFIHPDDIKVLKNIDTSNNGTGDRYAKYRFKHKSGKYIWLETSSKSIRDKNGNIKEVISVSRDITSRKKIEENLRIINKRFIAIFKNAGIGVVLRDKSGKLIAANTKYLEMLGYSKDEVKYTDDIVYEEDRLQDQMLFKELVDGKREAYRLERRYVAKDNRILWADVTVTRMPEVEGDRIFALATVNDITERKSSEHKLMELKDKFKELSLTDGLTQTANRRYFDEYIEKEWFDSAHKSRALSLILIDVDYFKAYNDTYGHIKGDECLKLVANTLKETLKQSNNFTTRYGGEEFAVVLPETDRIEAMHIAEKLRKNIESLMIPNINSKAANYVTISAGVATTVPSIIGHYKAFVGEADRALYAAKKNGRNRVEFMREYNTDIGKV